MNHIDQPANAPRLTAADIARALGAFEPTPEQAAVIEAPLAPTLVVAGAGAGKTETMAARVVYLVAAGIAPERICGLTFTRKAAAELSERIRARLRALKRAGLLPQPPGPSTDPLHDAGPGIGLGQPVVSTYNAYAAQLVREHGLRLGVDPDARVLSEASRWAIAARVIEQCDGLDTDASMPTLVTALLRLAGETAEHLLDPADIAAELDSTIEALANAPLAGRRKGLGRLGGALLANAHLTRQLTNLLPDYAAAKRAAGAIEFADQTALAAQLAAGDEHVRAAERSRFDVVLLDEYQDTSAAQLTMLRGLFGRGTAIMAVGDPHQSIYGWRGAAAGTLAAFPEHFSDEGRPVTVLRLSVAWRNDEAILECANALSAPLRANAPIELPALTPRAGAGRGEVRCGYFGTERDEATALAELLEREWLGPDGERPTAAVLCRKRSQFPAITAALSAAGLPFEVVGLGGLLAVPEVVDVVSFLTAAHDLSRGDALMRLATGPRYALGADDLLALGAWAKQLGEAQNRPAVSSGHSTGETAIHGEAVALDAIDGASIIDAIEQLPPPGWRSRGGLSLSDAGRASCAQLARNLAAVRGLTGLPLPDLIGYAARILGLDVELMVRGGAAGLRNIERLQDVARSFTEIGRTDYVTLGSFLDYLRAARERDERLDAEPATSTIERIQVMTIHGAKGLEWDLVCVPGLVLGSLPRTAPGAPGEAWWSAKGAVPHQLRGDAAYLPPPPAIDGKDVAQIEADLEEYRALCGLHDAAEDRRLAYVALTRARRLAFLTGSWWRGENKRPVEPSPFLLELAGSDAVIAPQPSEDAENPDVAVERRVAWPIDPLGARRPAIEAGAARVHDALAGATTATGPRYQALHERARQLLAEREETDKPVSAGRLRHVTATDLVAIERDPLAFAARRLRPMPQPPSPAAQIGTQFHQWADKYLGQPTLFMDEEIGSADEDWLEAPASLSALRDAFLSSEWLSQPERWRLLETERDVETSLDGVSVRCRVDAVFEDLSRPGYIEVVDWKTGRPPTSINTRHELLQQLAAYRLAFSRLRNLPIEQVSAALFFVSTGLTVRPDPDELADEAQLAATVAKVANPSAPDDVRRYKTAGS